MAFARARLVAVRGNGAHFNPDFCGDVVLIEVIEALEIHTAPEKEQLIAKAHARVRVSGSWSIADYAFPFEDVFGLRVQRQLALVEWVKRCHATPLSVGSTENIELIVDNISGVTVSFLRQNYLILLISLLYINFSDAWLLLDC